MSQEHLISVEAAGAGFAAAIALADRFRGDELGSVQALQAAGILHREWEYLARADNPFCANGPLFVVNNLKIVGLLATAILGVPLVLARGA